VSENVAGTVHTGYILSNKLGHIFVLMTSSVRCCYAPRTLVAAHVASVKGLGHKLSNKFGNLCSSPFTLATCAATCCRTCSATCGQCESTITRYLLLARRSLLAYSSERSDHVSGPVGRLTHLLVCRSVREVYCGKTADCIRMPLGMVSGVGRGMGVLDGGGDRRRGSGSFGMNWGVPL